MVHTLEGAHVLELLGSYPEVLPSHIPLQIARSLRSECLCHSVQIFILVDVNRRFKVEVLLTLERHGSEGSASTNAQCLICALSAVDLHLRQPVVVLNGACSDQAFSKSRKRLVSGCPIVLLNKHDHVIGSLVGEGLRHFELFSHRILSLGLLIS